MSTVVPRFKFPVGIHYDAGSSAAPQQAVATSTSPHLPDDAVFKGELPTLVSSSYAVVAEAMLKMSGEQAAAYVELLPLDTYTPKDTEALMMLLPKDTKSLDLSMCNLEGFNFACLPPRLGALKIAHTTKERLEQALDQCKELRCLEVIDSPMLFELPSSRVSSQIEGISLINCPKLRNLNGLHEHKLLRAFHLENSGLTPLKIHLSSFPQLNYLHLENTPVSVEEFTECPELAFLRLVNAPHATFPDAYTNENLLLLDLQGFHHLDYLDLSRFPSLQQARLENNPSLESIHGINDCKSLVELSVTYCEALREISPFPASLERVTLSKVSISKLYPFPALSKIRMVNLSCIHNLRELPSFNQCYQLRDFIGISLPCVKYIHGLGVCPNFNALIIKMCEELEAIAGPSTLPELRECVLSMSHKLKTFPDFWESKKLYRLEISHCKMVRNSVAPGHWLQVKSQMDTSGYKHPILHIV